MWDITINCNAITDYDKNVIIAFFVTNKLQYKCEDKAVTFYVDSAGDLMDTIYNLSEFVFEHGLPNHYYFYFAGTSSNHYVIEVGDHWDS